MKYFIPVLASMFVLGCGSAKHDAVPTNAGVAQSNGNNGAGGGSGSGKIAISTAGLPDAKVNLPYSETLTATGGTGSYTWLLSSGKLPTGLELNPDGVITGTPTLVEISTFVLQISDGNGRAANKTFSITVQ